MDRFVEIIVKEKDADHYTVFWANKFLKEIQDALNEKAKLEGASFALDVNQFTK